MSNLVVLNDIIKKKPVDYKKNDSKVYVGTKQFAIAINRNPVSIYINYVKYIIYNMYGYLYNNNINNLTQFNTVANLLCIAFESILNYNNIVHYADINFIIINNMLFIGEAMIYKNITDKEKLLLVISKTTVLDYLEKTTNFNITFGEDIEKLQCSLFNNKNNIAPEIIDDVLEQKLIKLFLAADKCATHFIKEYITGDPNWFNHQTLSILDKQYITSTSMLKLSSTITQHKLRPSFIVNGRQNNITSLPYTINVQPLNNSMSNIVNLTL